MLTDWRLWLIRQNICNTSSSTISQQLQQPARSHCLVRHSWWKKQLRQNWKKLTMSPSTARQNAHVQEDSKKGWRTVDTAVLKKTTACERQQLCYCN